ncbi:MAG TPA: hypothetical protein VIS06_20735 [Mycobacteriales bacterium]
MADIPTVTDGNPLDADLHWNPMAAKVNSHETRLLAIESRTWTDLTLNSPFANFGGTTFANLGWSRAGAWAYLRGVIKSTAATGSNAIIATLPAAARPSYAMAVVVPAGIGNSPLRVDIRTTGDVVLVPSQASAVANIEFEVTIPLG